MKYVEQVLRCCVFPGGCDCKLRRCSCWEWRNSSIPVDRTHCFSLPHKPKV